MTDDSRLLRARLEELSRSLADLEQLSERQTRFVALAAHELRAPAAVIDGIAATLASRADELGPEQRSALHSLLHEQTSRIVRLMDQLLDLSRLDGRAVRIERSRVAVRERVEALVGSIAGERADDVVVEVDTGLEALVDPDALDRILANLVTNALRYGEAPVRVRAEQADRHLRLTVEDEGAGVPDDFRPQLFERFSRAPSPTSTETGAGLGLAIAEQYALAHGGRIVYEQRTPHGARFRVVLPGAAVEAAAEAAPSGIPG